MDLQHTPMAQSLLPKLWVEGLALPYAHLQLAMACAMLQHARDLSGGAVDHLLDWNALFTYIKQDLGVDTLPFRFQQRELVLHKDLTHIEDALLLKAPTQARLLHRLLDASTRILEFVAGGETEVDYELMEALDAASSYYLSL
jgi:hypothetical protein